MKITCVDKEVGQLLEHFYFKYLHIQRRRNNLRTRF
jgi:hypothetical protein